MGLDELEQIFRGVGVPVWIAGGYALEIVAGASWRSHEDIDVLVMRPHWPRVQRHLYNWDIWVADPPGRLRKLADEQLPGAAHDLWLRRTAEHPWQLQIMIDELPGELPNTWVSRRDARISRHLSSLSAAQFGTLGVLAPEIQLFYKARGLRDKDQADFDAMLPLLSTHQRQWLAEAIALVHGGTHDWVARLS